MNQRRPCSNILGGAFSAVLVMAALTPTVASAESDLVTSKDAVCFENITTGESGCFHDYDGYITARGGNSTDGVVGADGLSQKEVDAMGAATRVIVAIFSEGPRFDGKSIIFEVSGHGCDAKPDVDWVWKRITSRWQNRIGSGVGYSRCQIRVFDLPNRRGAKFGGPRYNTVHHMGPMTHEAESVALF